LAAAAAAEKTHTCTSTKNRECVAIVVCSASNNGERQRPREINSQAVLVLPGNVAEGGRSAQQSKVDGLRNQK